MDRFVTIGCAAATAASLAACASLAGHVPSAAQVLEQERLAWSATWLRIHEEGGIAGPFEPQAIRDLRCRRAAGGEEAVCRYTRFTSLGQPRRVVATFRLENGDWRLQ